MEGSGGKGKTQAAWGNKDLSESGDMSVAEVQGKGKQSQAKYTGW